MANRWGVERKRIEERLRRNLPDSIGVGNGLLWRAISQLINSTFSFMLGQRPFCSGMGIWYLSRLTRFEGLSKSNRV